MAAYLLHSGVCTTAEEALQLFAVKRTKNAKGVTIPSQIRPVRLAHAAAAATHSLQRPGHAAVWTTAHALCSGAARVCAMAAPLTLLRLRRPGHHHSTLIQPGPPSCPSCPQVRVVLRGVAEAGRHGGQGAHISSDALPHGWRPRLRHGGGGLRALLPRLAVLGCSGRRRGGWSAARVGIRQRKACHPGTYKRRARP